MKSKKQTKEAADLEYQIFKIKELIKSIEAHERRLRALEKMVIGR